MSSSTYGPERRLSRRQIGVIAVVGWVLVSIAGATPHEQIETVAIAPVASTNAEPQADPSAIARVLIRAGATLSAPEREQIARAIVRYSAKYELDPELVTAVMLVESRGLPSARSPKGAMGLMQVMPAMLEPLGMVGNFTTVESNVEAGCLILADNIRRMGEADGILAYFWGPNIRGGAYLDRVRAARAEVRRILRSS